jgi:hypothetical protein
MLSIFESEFSTSIVYNSGNESRENISELNEIILNNNNSTSKFSAPFFLSFLLLEFTSLFAATVMLILLRQASH